MINIFVTLFIFTFVFLNNTVPVEAQFETGGSPPSGQVGSGESYLISGSGGNTIVSGGAGTGVASNVTVLTSTQYGYITTYTNSNGDTVTHYCDCGAGCCGSTPSTSQATQGQDYTPTVGETIDTCFLPGTKVTMGDGSRKNIEKVSVGETVLSMDPTEKVPKPATVLGTPISSGS